MGSLHQAQTLETLQLENLTQKVATESLVAHRESLEKLCLANFGCAAVCSRRKHWLEHITSQAT